MLLGFKTEINDKPTGFVGKILLCENLINGRDYDFSFQAECELAHLTGKAPKLHTIRDDPNDRWKPGMTIHFATGVRTSNLKMFAEGECVSKQDIVFRLFTNVPTLKIAIGDKSTCRWNLLLNDADRLQLTLNDGFDTWEEFDAWFRPLVVAEGGRMDRTLIHWTDLTY